MNIWKHSRLSAVNFGGEPEDYLEIHKFLDSSKLFYFHLKHRSLLHNSFGVGLCTYLFGDVIENSARNKVVVRDIAAQHLREDLSNHVPTVHDWFKDQTALDGQIHVVPEVSDAELQAFIHQPFLQSGSRASYLITCSDFGVELVRQRFGMETARAYRQLIPHEQNIKDLLSLFELRERWQYTPHMSELQKLKS